MYHLVKVTGAFGWVWLGQKGLPAPHSATWIDEGVVAQTCGIEGLDGKVRDPVPELIVTRHDDAEFIEI